MPAKDLGTKFTCFKCGTKFYDLKKPEPLCPKCGADQRESPALKPASKRAPREKAPVAVEPEVEDAAGDEDEDADELEEAGDEDVEDEPDDDA
ncbi:MAG: TIGR02300 family protein [Deltaproteobacteria bacterium]|nr:TIGR02300 family protein [Deltaproteobacteria bacterium]